MEEIIKVKPQWEHILRAHESKCNDIQKVVEKLAESGLTVTHGDVKDLINNGTALYNQAEQVAKSNAGIFKLPAPKKKFIEENTEILVFEINQAKNELNRVLAIESSSPLESEAFVIQKGVVSISETWLQQLKERFTIRATEKRKEAVELIQNVELAINALNDFVKDNEYFGTGVSTFSDTRRNLIWLSENGEINIDIENLEFI